MEKLQTLITIVQIFRHTPLWVWGLLVALVLLGHLQSKTRLLSKQRVVIVPAAMLALSFNGIASTFGLNLLLIGVWTSVTLAVVAANLFLRLPRGVLYSAAADRISVPGSWMPLAFMMLIFFTKYTVAVKLALSPELRHLEPFGIGACALYGVCSGFFLARAVEIARAGKRILSEVIV
jgi:hypothetical protein